VPVLAVSRPPGSTTESLNVYLEGKTINAGGRGGGAD